MKKFTNALMLGAISIATVVAMSSCGGTNEPTKDPELTITPIEGELHYADAVALTVTGAPADAEVTYESNNEWVAFIEGDSLFAWHIGEAVITATAGDKKATYTVKVTANPEYNVATEPKLDCWGISAAELKTKMGTDPIQDQVSKEGIRYVSYTQNKETATYETYMFENEADKLVSCYLQVQKVSEDIVKKYAYFLSERYIRVTVQGDEKGIYYANSLKSETTTLLIHLYSSNGVLFIQYQPYSHQSNAPALKPAKKGMPLFL